MRHLILVGVLVGGCGPAELAETPGETSTGSTTAEVDQGCPLLAHTPACGEKVPLEFIDPIGVPPDIRELAIRAAQYHFVWSLGAALTGDMAVYRGTASVRAWGQQYEVAFDLDPSTGVVYPGGGNPYTLMATEDEGSDRLTLKQHVDGTLELRAGGSLICTETPLDLSEFGPRLQGNLSCKDTYEEGEAELDYVRVPPEELSLEEALAALDITYKLTLTPESLEPCGPGLVYIGEEVELRDWSADTTSGTIYVDANVVYYVDPSCPQTIGVGRIELIRVESCVCGEHCHGRYDSECRCIGENYPPDDQHCG